MDHEKEKYLVCRDFGNHGVYLYIYSSDPALIVEKIPSVKIINEPPGWLLEKGLINIRCIDIDDPNLPSELF